MIGDSAGGNLAAAVALRARDEGAPKLAFQALIYPAVEHGWDTGSAHENAEGYLLQRESMHWFWDHYVPDKSLVDDWRVSPLAAADHSGLPPTFIATAEFDPLRDDGRAYHAKLHDAGVPVDLRRVRRDDPRLLLDAGHRRRRASACTRTSRRRSARSCSKRRRRV